jgi:hypothetical protein
VIPREAVAELHAELKLGERERNHGHEDTATMIFANVIARALVTLLASMTSPEKT